MQPIDEKDKSVAESVKAHRTLQETTYSKTILAELARTPPSLKVLDEAIASYSTTPVTEVDGAKGKIYDINMERVLNGTSYLLAAFFARNEVDAQQYFNLYKLKESHQSMLNTSAPHMIP